MKKENKNNNLPTRLTLGGGILNKKEDLELERFTKNKKRKFILIGLILGISVTIGGIFLYKSYAYYEEDKEYNVIKGIIPDFSYDVKFAIEVDGTKQDNIPTTPKGTGKDNYYKVEATCDDGITAEWDYNAWNLKIDNITKGTKCTLAFNSTLSEADYQKYIEAGVAYRRNTYRGKDITSKLNDGSLYTEIQSGHFDDIFVGDYIVDKKTNKKDTQNKQIVYLVADIDNYLHTGSGSSALTKHHLTIVPATPLITAQMNSTNTTDGGYLNSTMKTTTLTTILNDYINPVFGNDKILTLNINLSNDMNPDVISRIASTTAGFLKGAASGSKETSTKIDIMNEMNVFGSIVWSSSGFDIVQDNKQYALFRLKPELINYYDGKYMSYFLRDIASSYYYSEVYFDGSCYFTDASATNYGVRPRFLIG